jgi:capsular exopolysaccharide synthesis family protein
MLDDLVESFASNPDLVQEYAGLRSRLHLSRRPGLRSILVTSAQPREGKTTVVVNLGLASMLSGARAVLLDADMRRPGVHRRLEIPNTVGLKDLLTGTAHEPDVIQTLKTGSDLALERVLAVITAGQHGARLAEALGSDTLKATLNYLTTSYDLLLIDSPPVLAAPDALSLAPAVDGVVVVVHTGMVAEADLKLTKARLEEAGGTVLGVVMNRFDARLHGPSAHPYSAYYQG